MSVRSQGATMRNLMQFLRARLFKGRIFTAEQNSGWPKVGASIRPDELWGLDP